MSAPDAVAAVDRIEVDRIVVVDWSAAATPRRGRDSIWQADVAVGEADVAVTNPPTRHAWRADVLETLVGSVERGERVLVGMDASLGFAAGFAVALCGSGSGWTQVREVVASLSTDGPDNVNDRFAVAAELNRRCGAGDDADGPFWGHPPGRRYRTLGPTRPLRRHLPEWRATESALRAAGHRGIQSTWKLHGAGSVGGQALTALHHLSMLRDEVRRRLTADALAVWPQETGIGGDPWRGGAGVVVAEAWPPSAVPLARQPGEIGHGVRDAAQVAGLAVALAADARCGALGRRFAPGADNTSRWRSMSARRSCSSMANPVRG